ncbi:T9SS type A sorting domain-containing protein [Algivirga pacifica]|uniref:Secretion system C-terminal sorting domain-containing protein n=1 Tax=Algivirga pacifica TaxID=1162670 RepID=A0ABP9CZM6_9BACT
MKNAYYAKVLIESRNADFMFSLIKQIYKSRLGYIFSLLLLSNSLFAQTGGDYKFSQYGNNSADLSGTEGWQNGNLNPNQSHFLEGYSVPYRLLIDNTMIGSVYEVVFEFDIAVMDKIGLDYITSYDRLEPHSVFGHAAETVDPTLGTPFLGQSETSSFTVPAPLVTNTPVAGQPVASYNALPNSEKQVSMWGGVITDVSYVSGGDYTTNGASTQFKVTFTATAEDAIIAFGGHISSRVDWGLDENGESRSASAINGSPFQMRTKSVTKDGNFMVLGNRSRNLQAAAVFFVPSCQIEGEELSCDGENMMFNLVFPDYENPELYEIEWTLENNTSGAMIIGDTDGLSVTVKPGMTTGGFDIVAKVTGDTGIMEECAISVKVSSPIEFEHMVGEVACGEEFATFSGMISGGKPPYQVSITNAGYENIFEVAQEGSIGDIELAKGAYIVTIEDHNGCIISKEIVVEGEEGTPDAPEVDDERICVGTSAILSVINPDENCLYTWYATLEGDVVLGYGETFQTPNLSETTVYYVSCTIDGCESARTPVEVEVIDFKCNQLKQYWELNGISYGVTYAQDEQLYISLTNKNDMGLEMEKVTFYLYKLDDQNNRTLIEVVEDDTAPYWYDEQGINFTQEGAGHYILKVCQHFAPPVTPEAVECCYEIPFKIEEGNGDCASLDWRIEGAQNGQAYPLGQEFFFEAVSDNWTPLPEKVYFRIYQDLNGGEVLVDEYVDYTLPFEYNNGMGWTPEEAGIYKVKVYLHLPNGEVCFKQLRFNVEDEDGQGTVPPLCEDLEWKIGGIHQGHAVEEGETVQIQVNTSHWPQQPETIIVRIFEEIGLGSEQEIFVEVLDTPPYIVEWLAEQEGHYKVKFYAYFADGTVCFEQLEFKVGEDVPVICEDLIWSIDGVLPDFHYESGVTLYPSLVLENWVENPHKVTFKLFKLEGQTETLIEEEILETDPPYAFMDPDGVTLTDAGYYVLKVYLLLCSGEVCYKQVKFKIKPSEYSMNARIASLYPNPASTHLNILLQAPSEYDNLTLKIINVNGQEMMYTVDALSNGLHSIDVQSLPAGVYRAIFSNNGQVVNSYQFLKQ